MGIEDAASTAKDAAAGATEEAKGGLDGLLDKAKEFLTDDKIDDVAEKIKGFTPDSIDGAVDSLADKAKDANN